MKCTYFLRIIIFNISCQICLFAIFLKKKNGSRFGIPLLRLSYSDQLASDIFSPLNLVVAFRGPSVFTSNKN